MSLRQKRILHGLVAVVTGAGTVVLLATIGLAQQASPKVVAAKVAARSDAVDLTNAILTNRSASCRDHVSATTAAVTDIQRKLPFGAAVLIEAEADGCILMSNNIPNHDFNDDTAHFHTQVSTIGQQFFIGDDPAKAAAPTSLEQRVYDAVMLNGVPLDILSAGCYRPDGRRADDNGNVAVGCSTEDKWLLDPLGAGGRFGTDQHNAHTQPNGMYHYHGNPMALFDDHPGPEGSPVIGFAADGFPVYGSYFTDETGALRKAMSGYTLKPGTRASSEIDPGGAHDGMYVDDWEFTDAGDLDECNGMTVDGQYGYYVTDGYPWVIACFSGTPDPSFAKRRGGGGGGEGRRGPDQQRPRRG